MDMGSEIIKSTIGLFFGLLQSMTIALFVAGFKMYFDLKKTREDLDAAFQKIRELEKDLYFTSKGE